MSDFIPPRMEHVVIDEETQMTRYLAEIAMEDLLLLSGKRTERSGGLMAQYRKMAAEEHAIEAANEVASVEDFASERAGPVFPFPATDEEVAAVKQAEADRVACERWATTKPFPGPDLIRDNEG